MNSVLIYSTTTCPYCKMLKEYLDEKQIKYENIFVDQDQQAAERMVQESGQMGVPVTKITTPEGKAEYILGFDKPKINELLGIS